MAEKKILHRPVYIKLDRADLANPFRGITHQDLLTLSGVKLFEKEHIIIEKLSDGRIVVKENKDRLGTT